jgi:hypothetical protein
MPFGLIFSIILIVVFIVVAFYAIKHFLSLGDCAKVGQFYDDFQSKVDEAWRSAHSEFNITISLPSGVKQVCFANLSESYRGDRELFEDLQRYSVYEPNTFIIPDSKSCGMGYKTIKHINLPEITKTQNPYCIDVSKGISIKKDVYDKTVLLK